MKRILLTYFLAVSLIALFSTQNSLSKSLYDYNDKPKKDIVFKSVKKVEIINIEVYPNPADEYIYVKLNQKGSEALKFDVMSFIGNKMNVSSEKIETGLYKLNLRDIPSGHYYVIISDGTEKHIKKFIKK